MSNHKGLSATAGAIVFTLFVPVPAAGVIPWLMTRWQMQPALLGVETGRWLGGLMIVAGGMLFAWAMTWFAREGVKPYPPIERVITTGPYAYTRNPMYGGVVMVMLGQGLLFGSRAVVIYGLCWLAAFLIFERTIDDPFISKRMGKPYEDYLKSVPGWIPRRPRPRSEDTSSRV
jgi:protein-S-isoprenylcysteine O-methyltransferase Ste14